MRKAISAIIGILLLLAMCSCSASWHLNQAIKKGSKITTDTVRIETETIIPRIEKDTVFLSQIGDTVILEKERLKIKYVRLPGDTVYLSGEVQADTVIKVVEIPCDKTITAPPNKFKWYHWVLVCLGFGVVVAILTRFR